MMLNFEVVQLERNLLVRAHTQRETNATSLTARRMVFYITSLLATGVERKSVSFISFFFTLAARFRRQIIDSLSVLSSYPSRFFFHRASGVIIGRGRTT